MSARGSILLVDDEERIAKSLGRALREDGHDVTTAGSAEEARRLLAARGFDLLVVDNRMPGVSGLELIRELGEAPEPERPAMVMMTAHATVASAIEAMKLGALDYLQKPFEVEELLVVARRALELQRLRRQHRYLLQERDEEFDHYGIVGGSPAIRELMRTLERVARSRSTVLITGETGTGKELAARAIHARSAEREMPLVRVNCAAIPETLIESELFGHVRGAFTGATASKRGKFALADGGTIFLDEIGRLPLDVQAKLLRVLQEREVEPLGASGPQPIDVRVVAATNRDLGRLVAEGRFQEDLFYRLNVIPVVLPPLRERREDVALLAEHFARKHAQRLGREAPSLAPEALERLRSYPWPGNVRELENAIERAVVLGVASTITAGELGLPAAAPASGAALPGPRLKDNVEWAERQSVTAALREARCVKKDAAELLGISQRALSYYLSKYPLD
jgi:two-component system response regulator AtoC